MSWSGARGRKAFAAFKFNNNADKDKPDVVLAKFRDYFEPKTNKLLARYNLHELRQMANQTIHEFLTECIHQAGKCKLKDQNDIDDHVLEQLRPPGGV